MSEITPDLVRHLAGLSRILVTEEEVKAFVKERLAAYKYPRYIQFVNELPKTATGKIQRFRLRDLENKKA